MSDLSAASVPVNLLTPTVSASTSTANAPMSAAETAKRAQIHSTAQKFEASFLSVMMQSMTAGMKTPEIGGGGAGEDMFKSLLAEQMAQQVTKSGGVGIAASIQKEMLKMQGLKE